MARTFRPFTHNIPMQEDLVTVFDLAPDDDNGEPVFACTVDEKIDLLLDCTLPVYVAWPGQYSQHIFSINTTEERREALKLLLA
jgi:hypothetical protein